MIQFNFKWAFFLLLILNLQAFSQINTKTFEKYSVAEGIPEEYVTDMIQDDKGFIWFTTQNGLVKYDGYNFQVFKDDGSKNPDKVHFINFAGGVLKGKDGKIWVGTFAAKPGIAVFDPKTEKFKNYYPESKKGERSLGDFLILLLEDSSGNIWSVYTNSTTSENFYCRFNPKTEKIIMYPVKEPIQISLNAVTISESSNAIWLLDDKSNINKWNREKDTFEKVFAAGEPLSIGFPSDTIRNLIKGRDNRLLLMSNLGLYVFDTKIKRVKSYISAMNNAQFLSKAKALSAFEDLKGQYWVFYEGGKISRINQDASETTTLTNGIGPLFHSIKSGPVMVFKIASENKKGIWFQALNKDYVVLFFMYYDYQTRKFKFSDKKFNVGKNPLPPAPVFYNFMEDRTGLLWLCTRPDFYKEAPKKRQMELYKHEKENGASIPSDTILQLFEDSKKRVWIGTSNGVALYNSELKSFRSFRHTKQASSLSNNKIGTITEDADGYIWVGTENGINKYQENSGTFKRYFYSDKNPNNCLFIKSDRKGRLWLSIYDKGVFILDKKSGLVVKHFNTNKNNLGSLTSQRITTFFEASDGTVWLGDTGNHIDKETEKFGLYHLNAAETIFTQYLPNKNDPNAISSDQINFLAEDSSKRLWIGFDEGMNLYDAKTNRFKMYDDGHLVAFAGSVKDKSGNIWFTSYGGKGLISIDVDSSKISAYGDEQGLLNNDINEVALDDSGMIWIPNQRGLSVFNPNSKKFIKNYFEKDGFQPYSYDYIVLKSSNGDIWIGGSKGLNKIVPSQLLNKDPIPPSVVITQITINGISYSKPDGTLFKQSVPYTTEIELSSNQKDLNFNFVALHYLRAEDNLYSWKLQNYDKDWSEPSNIRTASYTNLSPGTYVFRIMASNADGVWTAKDTSIKITILPPWWKSWWSYLLYAIIFTAALSFFIAYRAAALKKQNKILEEKVELRTTQLQTSLTNLKDTQSQLIQSEKMASLGELTAGIAHEIQNPLNFVNNFSEVSSELLDEMNLEIEKGDFDEAKAIAIDLKQNLEKINHHGKRADGIVKGMLQHSRRTSGVKQLTDLNALCDEYLRLSYHGLRAKDKSFNAIMKTDFDTTIGKINIIPQDFGRVVLNLLTNAFYAADEKKKSGIENYEPTISISTKTIDDKLEIKISDNGGGIPANAIDKIFQPFFTTKPTGQGTGLGLSLSYDIVKAHGGELKVETKEKIGTDFIIILPITT